MLQDNVTVCYREARQENMKMFNSMVCYCLWQEKWLWGVAPQKDKLKERMWRVQLLSKIGDDIIEKE